MYNILDISTLNTNDIFFSRVSSITKLLTTQKPTKAPSITTDCNTDGMFSSRKPYRVCFMTI